MKSLESLWHLCAHRRIKESFKYVPLQSSLTGQGQENANAFLFFFPVGSWKPFAFAFQRVTLCAHALWPSWRSQLSFGGTQVATQAATAKHPRNLYFPFLLHCPFSLPFPASFSSSLLPHNLHRPHYHRLILLLYPIFLRLHPRFVSHWSINSQDTCIHGESEKHFGTRYQETCMFPSTQRCSLTN